MHGGGGVKIDVRTLAELYSMDAEFEKASDWEAFLELLMMYTRHVLEAAAKHCEATCTEGPVQLVAKGYAERVRELKPGRAA